MNGCSQRSLLVFADDWGRHPSSCQHLVRRLRANYKVLWVNTIGTRRPQLNAITWRRIVEKLTNWKRGLRQVSDTMWVIDLPMLPNVGGRLARALNQRIATRQLNDVMSKLDMSDTIVLTTLPYVLWMIDRITKAGLIYYVTDDYSHWPGADRDALLAADSEMSRAAQIVLAVSHSLLARYELSPHREYFPHGVDRDHFASARSCDPPTAIVTLPRPRIGFFGLIYEKLNFELLTAVARHFSTASIVMIGPIDYCDETFASLPNVHFVGKQPYEQLPAWISGLDALMLPYVDDEMIRQSGPLKLRECLATGKPTISVDIPEVRTLQPHVRVAASIVDFLSNVESSLSESDARLVEARQRAVRNDDWDERAKQLHGWIQTLSKP
jgi:glycosyltransferase involved in cell wall biosynthesis